MDTTLALHTAARRWLMDRQAHWVRRHNEIREADPRRGAINDLETWPRHSVVGAMLEGVETLRPEEMASLEAARVRIAVAGLEARNMFTQPAPGELEEPRMTEERAAFAAFVRGVGEAELARVQPLPCRRVLGEDEDRAIWDRIRERWDVDGYWYPLGETSRADVIAYADDAFQRAVGSEGLRRILERRGVRRVWEIREFGPSYEMDVVLLEPEYSGGAEGFWSAGEMDWLVYASHEGSVTIGGAGLMREVEAAWPEWERHLWRVPPS